MAFRILYNWCFHSPLSRFCFLGIFKWLTTNVLSPSSLTDWSPGKHNTTATSGKLKVQKGFEINYINILSLYSLVTGIPSNQKLIFYVYLWPDFWKRLRQIYPLFRQTVFLFSVSKVATIKPRVQPLLVSLLLLSSSSLPLSLILFSFSFASVIFELIGRKKLAFWPFFNQAANFARFVFN